jgi:hypothetical protein
MLEDHIFLHCHWAAPDPMGVGAAEVHADWLALASLWEAPASP